MGWWWGLGWVVVDMVGNECGGGGRVVRGEDRGRELMWRRRSDQVDYEPRECSEVQDLTSGLGA